MHANVSLWKIKSRDSVEALLKKAETELIPVLRNQPGFIDLDGILADKDTLILIHTWESKEKANVGVRRLVPWLLANAATKLSPISRHSGNIVLSTSVTDQG